MLLGSHGDIDDCGEVACLDYFASNLSPFHTCSQDHSIFSNLQMNINVLVKPRDWASIRMISLRSENTSKDEILLFTLFTIWYQSISVFKVVILLFNKWWIGQQNWNHQLLDNMMVRMVMLLSFSRHPGFRFYVYMVPGWGLCSQEITWYIPMFWLNWYRRYGKITTGEDCLMRFQEHV